LFPARLTARSKRTGALRVAKVRIWADDEYRAQNGRWQHGFDEQLDDANEVMIPTLGVRLEAEYRSWDHHMSGGALADHLDALARTDTGDDVVWVVGLTSSLSQVSVTYEQLGATTLGGRHLILRGHADLEERKAFERAFPDIGPDARESVLAARRRHKTAAVLLHELAHSLAALHELEPGGIMSATYSYRAAPISDRNRALMQIVLEDRLKPLAQRDPPATTRALLATLEVGGGGWDADDRAQLVARLRAPGRSTDVESEISNAAARLVAGDAAGARTMLVAAEARLASLAPDQTTAAWLRIAGQYRQMNAVTWAEDALARSGVPAGADHGIAAWAKITRARYGIPRDGAHWKLTSDDDPAAVIAVRDAVALVNASEFDTAAKAIGAAERRWPALPGLLAARCALEFRRDALAAARTQCDRAIAQGGSSWALYLRGLIEQHSGRSGATAASIARFRAAIQLDPDLVQVWQALGRALDRTKATAEIEQLRADYRARFNTRLPN
jgi:tetratricopeptide (TPR) repeat protein